MAWGFLTNHAQALLCIADDPGVRLREIATTLGITERAAFGIVTDLVEAGYVVKDKNGRRNRYAVQVDKPLPGALLRQRTVGQLVTLLARTDLELATTPEHGSRFSGWRRSRRWRRGRSGPGHITRRCRRPGHAWSHW